MENIAILVPFFSSLQSVYPDLRLRPYFVERLNFFFSFLFLLLRLVCECLRAFWLCAEKWAKDFLGGNVCEGKAGGLILCANIIGNVVWLLVHLFARHELMTCNTTGASWLSLW
jgi:hypothetical protein